MMKGRVAILVCLMSLLTTGSTWAAGRLDSCLNWPVMAVPVINTSPETSWVFGAAVQGYFRLPGQERTSIVQLDGAYSLSHQWYLNTSGMLYMGTNTHWILGYSLGYRDYPDTYYELGNTFCRKQGTGYTSQRFRVQAQPMYVLPMNWAAGLDVYYLYEQTSIAPTISMLGLGVAVQYDTRDILFYPHRGLFFKCVASHYESLNGNYDRMGLVKTDLRQFVPIYKDFLFAWQFRTEWAIGNDSPFPLLPTLGGQDLVRGVRAGMFRDNAMLALQTEFRIPIYSILHAAVFAGVGDVYDMYHWQWTTPKVGYGLGLRLAINRAKVNIRFDLARNNIYKEWNTWESYSFYLTATEAF